MRACANCQEREAVVNWLGTGGPLAYIHGHYEIWCEVCVLEEQLKFAETQAMKIHKLRKDLIEAKKEAGLVK